MTSTAAFSLVRAVRVIHPFPTALNAVAAVGLAFVAADGTPGLCVLARIALTMLAAQAAIGAINDVVDRLLDAGKPWKPVAAGLLSARTATLIGVGCALLSLAVGATLGPAAWALSAAGLAIGFAYDLWLKRTVWSWITYAVALPLVPVWVWTAVDRFTPLLHWVWPLGMLLGLSLHLANALTDWEADSAAGVRGAAQRLGWRLSLGACWAAFALAVLLALVAGIVLGSRSALLLGGCGLAAALLTAAIAGYLLSPSRRSLQRAWTLLAPAAGILATGWLAALPK